MSVDRRASVSPLAAGVSLVGIAAGVAFIALLLMAVVEGVTGVRAGYLPCLAAVTFWFAWRMRRSGRSLAAGVAS